MPKIPNRASPLPPEERKAAIIRAVIPAIIEHGSSLTSRQIAEAAGVAEGTIFRVFGDKETLIREAADVYLDPAPVRVSLSEIDPALSLEEKVSRVLAVLRQRFHGVISIMAAIGHTGGEPPHVRSGPPGQTWEYASIVARLVQPELDRLNVPAEHVAPFIRLIAFAMSIPGFTVETSFDDETLTRLIVYGIAGDTAVGNEDATRKKTARALTLEADAGEGHETNDILGADDARRHDENVETHA